MEKFYPEKNEGAIPTIEEIEMKQNQITSKDWLNHQLLLVNDRFLGIPAFMSFFLSKFAIGYEKSIMAK